MPQNPGPRDPDFKPKHAGGYAPTHTNLCERTPVSLLRGLGPWKGGVRIIGGLVPRYLIPRPADGGAGDAHVGTMDVDLVLDIEMIANVTAYRRLERNLKELGFTRATNDKGDPQHYRWERRADNGDAIVVVDLLCDTAVDETDKRVAAIPKERRLSALKIPGAHLAIADYIEVPVEADLLDGAGRARETLKVANIVPFIVLKALAYDDRKEEKDAYDLIYTLSTYGSGPQDAANAFAAALRAQPEELLLPQAREILRERFATDATIAGPDKDGPVAYARFIQNIGQPHRNMRHRRDAAGVVEEFLHHLDAALGTE